jgi:alanine-alpha-ketoisovalerate/valine-pyruvate aminotransferase
MDYCLEGINQSMSAPNSNIKRYTKLYLTLLQIRFDGYEDIAMEINQDFKVKRIDDVKKIVSSESSLGFENMSRFSRVRRAEEMYTEMINRPSNPLAKVITVGCLRSVLKLATLGKSGSSGKNGADKCKFSLFFTNFSIFVNFLN